MSFQSDTHPLVSAVGALLAKEVRTFSIKEAAGLLDTSLPTVVRMRNGEIPTPRIFLSAIKLFGLKILKPVTDEITDEIAAPKSLYQAADYLERLIGELKNERNARASASAPSSRLVLGRGGADDVRSRLAGGKARQLAADEGGEGGPEATRTSRSVSLIETRRTFGSLSGRESEALGRHLTALDNVVSLDHARQIAQSDNRRTTGLAYRRQGEDWTILPAADNRLWVPSNDPRKATDFDGDVQALRRDLDEATKSAKPIYVTHAGAFVRGGELLNFNSTVVRLGGRSKCGADLVLTDFVRRSA